MSEEPVRCAWADAGPAMIAYHDEDWGVPVHDDRKLFEMIILEGAQAGLSWRTVLERREGYRRAFEGFDAERIARWGPAEVDRRLADPGIVRNRAKVESAVTNARAFLAVVEERGAFAPYLWCFVGGEPVHNGRRSLSEVPARTPASRALSRDLERRGFRFVGPTICYALMQSVGMVNDHTVDCFRHAELAGRPADRPG